MVTENYFQEMVKKERSFGAVIRMTKDRVDPLEEVMVDKAILGNSLREWVAPLRLERVKRVAYWGERMTMMARLLVILKVTYEIELENEFNISYIIYIL